MENKNKLIAIRISADDAELILRASIIDGRTLSSYIRKTALDSAKNLIELNKRRK